MCSAPLFLLATGCVAGFCRLFCIGFFLILLLLSPVGVSFVYWAPCPASGPLYFSGTSLSGCILFMAAGAPVGPVYSVVFWGSCLFCLFCLLSYQGRTPLGGGELYWQLLMGRRPRWRRQPLPSSRLVDPSHARAQSMYCDRTPRAPVTSQTPADKVS